MDRRNVLKAAVAAPFLGSTPAAGAPASGLTAVDAESPRFTIAVLPDTQYLFDADSADPEPLLATFRYLLQRRTDANIVFMTHLGDVTEHGTAAEIALAAKTFAELDGHMPYSVLAGNHDVVSTTNDQRGPTPYLSAFGPDRFAAMPTFVGATPDGYNTAHLVSAGGRRWLVLALDWRVSDGGLAWAHAVIAQHRSVPAIVTTHDLAYGDDAGQAFLSSNGQRLWDLLIRDNDQVFLTLNGHHWPPGRTVLQNAAGHDVHLHITNYQDRYFGGAGMIRLYKFDLVRNVIDVETFAPWFLGHEPAKRSPLEAETLELTSDVDRFSIPVDFGTRFAGFDPPAVPVPRPASAMIDQDTVAYWRFDAPGQTVSDGARVRDATGHGNDLIVRRLANSGPETLTLSTDHHAAQPGHASLLFDGGKDPDRGAILQTGAQAPLNSMTFLDGYTFELFVKLPDPFVGDHAFMGIFSWEGRDGDAGKSSSWTPLEPTCSLNVSSERFLQYIVYPYDRDASPTSWSHALPPGRWTHIAIVNDGRRTVIWVDRSMIVRNPAQPSHGIATLGRPFTLGATSFDLRYGQGFYGSIGDVRVTARALPPNRFMA